MYYGPYLATSARIFSLSRSAMGLLLGTATQDRLPALAYRHDARRVIDQQFPLRKLWPALDQEWGQLPVTPTP
jgi:hypothetical protein